MDVHKFMPVVLFDGYLVAIIFVNSFFNNCISARSDLFSKLVDIYIWASRSLKFSLYGL